MTKQEEIREGIAERKYKEAPGWECYQYIPFKDAPEVVRIQYLRKADDEMAILHSQGIVIKVEGRLCTRCKGSGSIEVGVLKGGVFRGRNIDCPDCKGTGKTSLVATKPLIEPVTHKKMR